MLPQHLIQDRQRTVHIPRTLFRQCHQHTHLRFASHRFLRKRPQIIIHRLIQIPLGRLRIIERTNQIPMRLMVVRAFRDRLPIRLNRIGILLLRPEIIPHPAVNLPRLPIYQRQLFSDDFCPHLIAQRILTPISPRLIHRSHAKLPR